MILVLDNYDSFTWNLVQMLEALGARTEVVRNDERTVQEIERQAPERIVISPGPCTPGEAGISTELVRALGPRTPILGFAWDTRPSGKRSGARPSGPGASCTARPHPSATMVAGSSRGFPRR